jgi:hypothetical protein
MACPTANVKFRLRRATANEWATTTTILLDGEPGFDTTNNILKIGNAGRTWAELKPVNINVIDGGNASSTYT